MQRLAMLLVLAASVSMGQQTPVQLTQVPPKPTCVVILPNGSCADLWRAYNQALQQRTREELQVYINRQKELASEQATAPLQQQITDLNKLVTDQQEKIKNLQEQLQSDASAALQAKADAHLAGLKRGAIMGAISILLLLGLIVAVRKFAQTYSIAKKPVTPHVSA